MNRLQKHSLVLVSAAWTALVACVSDGADVAPPGSGADTDAGPNATPPTDASGGSGDGGAPARDATALPTSFAVGGALLGLVDGELVLRNNGGDDLTLVTNGAFAFTTRLSNGAAYDVTVAKQPAGQSCAVAGGSGAVAGADADGVEVLCTPSTYTVGGTVSGLVGTLVLEDGFGAELTVVADGAFQLPRPIAHGAAYAVVVKTAPTNPEQSCTVTNGGGRVAAANVTDITVTCVTQGYAVGGTVAGLTGASPLVLRNNGGDDVSITANGAFRFPTPLLTNASYQASIASQPSGNLCSLARASGTVTTSSITDIGVTCTSYRATVLAASPLAYFRLEDAAGPVVSQVGSATGALSGAVTLRATGLVAPDSGATFTTDGMIEVPFASERNPSGNFSIEAWIKVAKNSGAYQSILTSRDTGGADARTGYVLYLNPTLQPELWVGANTFWSIVPGPAPLALGTVYHLVGTYEGTATGTLTLYVNGVAVGNVSVPAFGPNASRPLRIGGGATEGPGLFFFEGTIDEVAIYGKVLTPSEVERHYTLGSNQR